MSKLLDVFFNPLAWAMVLIAVGLGWRDRPRHRRWFAIAGLATLWLFSFEPIANALERSLEDPPVRTVRSAVTYDVVVLLDGLVNEAATRASGAPSYEDNVERMLTTFDLLRTGRAHFAIVSGGAWHPERGEIPEAQIIARQLVAWGIEPARIVIEARSRNTHENAVESAHIVAQRGWRSVLVVTSAYHMPRALGCFRAEGLAVDALPVDFRSYGSHDAGSWIPRAAYLQESSEALREWAGRAVYRLRGYTRAR